MQGSWRAWLLVAGTVLLTSPAALPLGGHFSQRPADAVAYASPSIYCIPFAMPLAPSSNIPARPVGPALAKPTPAPPSGSVEPPREPSREPPLPKVREAPKIIESRSHSDTSMDGAPPVGRCRVGFWNITGRDVTLTIDGQARKIAKDHALTLELSRSFVWQLDGRPPQTERVSVEQTVYEVILRP